MTKIQEHRNYIGIKSLYVLEYHISFIDIDMFYCLKQRNRLGVKYNIENKFTLSFIKEVLQLAFKTPVTCKKRTRRDIPRFWVRLLFFLLYFR